MRCWIVGMAVVIAGVLGSCKSDEKPPGVLSKAELVEFFVDMYVAEARMASVSVVTDSSKKLFQPFEEALLKRKGIPDSVMKKTYRYYADHPIELEEVYDIVIDTLSLREQKAGLKPK